MLRVGVWVRICDDTVRGNVGSCPPHMWGFFRDPGGGRRRVAGRVTQDAMEPRTIWESVADTWSGSAGTRLDQVQLFGPFDCRPPSGNVELAVDAFGMR